ncbi:MAG TPA: SPOR domain-containing protein [Rhizomicrobium sp.]|jgi:D-alanyl-D-alanine carboxypeptidase|nr:SPOR domain-containing protein [Rhizomicrobium sp.]
MLTRPRTSTGAIAKAIFSASILLALVAAGPALARHHPMHSSRHSSHVNLRGGPAVGLTDPDKDAALILDGTDNKVLYARNADQIRHPASLTKMMTLYLLFERLKSGQMTMQTQLPISAHASEQHPTKLHLRPGSSISVDTAIRAIVIHSANDVAVAIAESIGGTESHFAEMMTAKAHQLGMMHTFYHNASGLPDELQVTTASDLGILAHHLAYDFPQYYPFFSITYFTFRGETYPTHDNLIGNYQGADGIKTGFTEASGFNLVSSVVRDNHHIIGIVMGGRSAHMRDREMVRLLDDTFVHIAADPAMVATAHVPWRMAQPQLVADLGAPAVPGGAIRIQPNGLVEDEDSAEARHDPADDTASLRSNVIAPTPRPQPAVAPSRPAVLAAFRPTPRPQQAFDLRRPAMLASNISLPSVRPMSRAAALGEGDIDSAPFPAHRSLVATFTGIRDWTIQIGAFADAASAKAQLASYAEHSMDVLGQAQRIVAPFQSVDGHTLYRARFGPFVEAEARAVCQRLTERGQTCFAATGQR